jgi:FtsP/CotA-like multicopper oxidase with cupredoxin domain
MRRARLCWSIAVALLPSIAAGQQPLERVTSNNNRLASGTLRNGVLELKLEIRNGQWYPEADNGPSVPIEAFAEAGKPVSNPGPLIRVPEGTEIRIAIRNTLDKKSARVFGLHSRPSSEDSGIVVTAGGTTNVRFKAGAPGTYYYWATTTDSPLGGRGDIDSQLSGALVIDPRSPAFPVADRVFVLGIWFEEATKINGVEKPERELLVINGKSWPNTERFTFTVGDTVRWRWVNPTTATHPMHLHGFYYDVTSRGQMNADTIFSVANRRMVNTELMRVGSTMAMTFVPQKPGNWVFHCHFAFHVSGDRSLQPPSLPASEKGEHAHMAEKPHAMAGLVLGIHVEPKPGEQYAAAPGERRNLRLLLQSSPARFGDKPAYGFVLQDGDHVPAIDSVAMPGPTLMLKRGEPVRITVVNNLKQPSAVHWHGIELESFPDGVPNWSGIGSKLMPPIAPADSFIAEFTPPRSGTFMYHSHLNEGVQINSGMYAPLIVMDDPAKFDRLRDKIILVGGGGPEPLPGMDTRGFVNGSPNPPPIQMETGTTYRLRLINIHPNWRVEFTLGTDTTVAKWRPIAKDGGDLPPSQRIMQSAYLLTGPGETADFEYTPTEPGAIRLTVKTRVSGWVVPVNINVRNRTTLATAR